MQRPIDKAVETVAKGVLWLVLDAAIIVVALFVLAVVGWLLGWWPR